VPNTWPDSSIDPQEVANRNNAARQIIAGFSTAAPTLPEVWQQLEAALADAPALSAEISQLRDELADTRVDRANLLAAARAVISAHMDGEPDPLSYLRDELQARGQLPTNPGSSL
jgi:ABC-type transporter Mla subunit MlaD